MSQQGRAAVRAADDTSKRALPSIKLVEKKIRVTEGQMLRVAQYCTEHGAKKNADAWRDVVNAGLRVLVPTSPVAGTISGQEQLRRAA